MNYIDLRNNKEIERLAKEVALEISKLISTENKEELFATTAVIESLFYTNFGYELWMHYGRKESEIKGE